ncbi:TIGR03617 family F420-dependent LLM class oxidoreductase [SAR202 cluster bacterium AD-804-J14_MRT_500m]|nr:TIGR03617 family F420-dependent LLM class oxidoreductase [SAR202 cluster bacterium AD-804-J14_MRT_500m]
MKIGFTLDGRASAQHGEESRHAEKLGYNQIVSHETGYNPFFPLVIAAQATQKVDLVTSIAVAFARSPMDIAYTAWDLQALSRGRFILGLGSQVRGHIVRRFNMPWSSPASRMREYILALRAIWDSWQQNARLNFSGQYYHFNLMPPVFNPGAIEHPNIPVQIAAVNPQMLQVAGEVCDGVLLHTFISKKYTNEIVLPNLELGATKSGRTLDELEISGGGFIVSGSCNDEVSVNRERVRKRIAFYASTRSYESVMSLHGWQATAQNLYRMSVDGKWHDMAGEITDDMLDTFAVVGTYDTIVDKIIERFGAFSTTINFSIPMSTPADEVLLKEMLKRLQSS